MINFKDYIQPLLVGDELKEALAVYPKYDEAIRKASASDRLLALSALNDLYIPVEMSIQIYSKLYLTLIRSLEQKGTVTAIRQVYENHNSIKGLPYKGLMGGADSWCIVAPSGVGKSSAIGRAMIIPNIVVDCKRNTAIADGVFCIMNPIRRIKIYTKRTLHEFSSKIG